MASDHSEIGYKGFRLCKVCGIILCPLNERNSCKGKKIRDAKSYIDKLTAGATAPTALDKALARVKELEEALREIGSKTMDINDLTELQLYRRLSEIRGLVRETLRESLEGGGE